MGFFAINRISSNKTVIINTELNNLRLANDMICAVYKSRLKLGSYLFVNNRNEFDRVPDTLMAMFGTPQLVMLLPLDKRQCLEGADIDKVKTQLQQNGYYLQLPPPKVNLLKEHLSNLNQE